jgi:hypothetical protein
MSDVILGGAAVDCEQLRAGLLAQPANSLSSLAFVAGGPWIVLRARRHVPDRDGIAVGLATIAAGIGSLLFHAGDNAVAHWLHDTTLLVVFTLVAIRHVGRKRLSLARAAPFVAVIAGATVAGFPASTALVVALLVGGVAVGVFVEWRRRESVLHLPLAATMLFGLSASWFGRRGSALCSPESILQLHALWHIVIAVSIAWWADRAVLTQRSFRNQHHELPGFVADDARDVAGTGHVLGEPHVAGTESLLPSALDLDFHLTAQRDDVHR